MDKYTKLDTERKAVKIGNYLMTGKTLGKGHFAHVLEGFHILLKVKAAIKVIDTQDITDDYVKKNLKREARIMSKISHPNIVYLFETLETKRHYYIVTEMCSGGDLCNFVKSQVYGKLNEKQARTFARQLVLAVSHLHSRGIIHRDLKMENILLDTWKKRVKIVDFGLSNFYDKQNPLKTHCGSPEYAAPELYVSGKIYGPEVDIWSLGIIFYGMLVGKLPFQTWHKPGFTNDERTKHLMIETKNGLTIKHQKYLMDVSYRFRNLINQMLKPDSCERISMHELQINSWIAETPYMKPIEEYPNEDRRWKRNIIAKIADWTDISYNEAYEKITDTPYGQLAGIYNMEKFIHLNNRTSLGIMMTETKRNDKTVMKPNKDDSKSTTTSNRSESKMNSNYIPSKRGTSLAITKRLENNKAALTLEKQNINIKRKLQKKDCILNGMKCDATASEKSTEVPVIHADTHYNLVRKTHTLMKTAGVEAGLPLSTLQKTPTFLNEKHKISFNSIFLNENNETKNIYAPHNNPNNKIKFRAKKDKNNEIANNNIYNNNLKNFISHKHNKLESIYLNKNINLNTSKTNGNSNSKTAELIKNNFNTNLNKDMKINKDKNNMINNKNNDGFLRYLFPFKSKEIASIKFSRNSNSSKINLLTDKKSSGVTSIRNSNNSNINTDIDKNKSKKVKNR